ncbi:MAG: TerB N-terminal domain-containing protein [Clostridia bacterium]|nr:TerB N-terminal domain-containing protein [Clostridia bacterium]
MGSNKRKDELDAFWDIDGLMPAKRPGVQRKPGATDAVEIEVTAAKPQADHSEAKLSRTVPTKRSPAPEAPITPEAVYDMKGGLVHRVSVYPWKSGYTYYEKFCRDGEYLRKIHGKEAPHVGFFSYMPQYGQMTKAQLSYYLWWRENIRSNGIYLPADYSYILLNMYELINLPDDHPEKVRDALCSLWVAYHKDVPRLDRYFAEWICDYCLLHGLSAPVQQLESIRDDVLAAASLKEFYLDCGEQAGGAQAYAKALLGFCCQYDYRKSKFATGESKALYDEIIPGVLVYLLEQNGAGAEILRGKGSVQESVISRDSYVAALCSHRIKKRIEVRYCSVSRSHELRFAVTDMVKYTENRIRAHMGVKSRLSVNTLSDEIKREMDGYLDRLVPRMKSREQEQVEQYEKLYDLPTAPLDLSHSAEIEQASWETTKKLVEAFETVGADVPDAPPNPVGANHDSPAQPNPVGADVFDGPQDNNVLADALADYMPFIAAVAAENASAQRNVARTMGKMVDAVADEINEIAADVFGDVILEQGDDGYIIIEDYREQMSFLWEE